MTTPRAARMGGLATAGWVVTAGSLAAAGLAAAGCTEPRVPSAGRDRDAPVVSVGSPSRPAAPLAVALAQPWGVPRFFEIGKAVRLAPGARPVDTTGWIQTVLDREAERRRGAEANVLVYPEIDAASGELRRYALVLPATRPFSANGLVAAHWDPGAEAFDFGVERTRTVGQVSLRDERGRHGVRNLKARFSYSGTNVQDAELVYDIESSRLGLFEHKGLVPGAPASFARFVVFDRNVVTDADEPIPIADADGLAISVALRPDEPGSFAAAETFEAEGYRVLLTTTEGGELYFLAAPSATSPSWSFGAGDRAPRDRGSRDRDRNVDVVTMTLRATAAGVLFSGKVDEAREVAGHLAHAKAFVTRFEQAMAGLREGGDGLRRFLGFYTHSFLDSHRSRRDPRAMMELPYGDAYYPRDVVHSSANVWYGSDQASVLEGLVHYFRKTGDRSVLGDIRGLADSSTEAMTPTGSVWMKRFDEMLVTTETDENTGRADAYIDNGAVSACFNHRRLVLRRGYERIAGVTWGAFEPVIDGRAESVDHGYSFAVDETSLPETFSTDQDSLSVARVFTRQDGNVRVRERARVDRGVPAARIEEEVENTGRGPRKLEEVRLTIGDFFHYGDGTNEIAQNRYGFSRVFEGVPLHVGFWMEGMPEPLWGDNFAPGWVDVTAAYRRHGSRFLVIYGYDKAQLYYLPRRAHRVRLYNAGGADLSSADGRGAPRSRASKDGYRGWTSLQVAYDEGATLAPGATYTSPPVYSYTLWAPLFSADDDTVPDEVQTLAPLWTSLVEAVKDDGTADARERRLRALPDRNEVARLLPLLHTSIESDYAYAGMQFSWMETVDLLRSLARKSADPEERRDLSAHADRLKGKALRGAEFTLRAFTQLRNRSDLMPAFGIMRYYGFNIAVFDWAFRETCDVRYRDAMIYVADRISGSEKNGGLQVTDPSKPNYGAYVINELSRAAGANNLDDQGIKLWALRIAYERTGNPRYRRSAELNIDHWIKVRPRDHLFFGTSKLFNRYVPTGLDQQRTPYGHYTLLLGLEAWADLHRRARELHTEGMKNATQRHGTHAVGTAGAYYMAFPDEGMVHYGTNAELGGTFLWALAFDGATLRGRHRAACGAPRGTRAASTGAVAGGG